MERILSMHIIHKRFAGVHALKGVSLDLNSGEILGLIGENGSGKTTLMRVLMGIERRDEGTIVLHGSELNILKPIEAYERGIGMVFQEQALFPNLSVAENIFLGHEELMQTAGILHWKQIRDEAKNVLKQVGLTDLNPKTRLERLSFSQRQMVEIGRVLYSAFRTDKQVIIILDEPTTVLSPNEVGNLFKIINSLRQHAAFVFISHHLDEIIKYTDRVVVLKDGENVGEEITGKTSIKVLQELMVGREFSTDFYFAKDLRLPEKDVVLQLNGISAKSVKKVNFALHRGEILGIAGLMGCGKEDLAKIIFGDTQIQEGTITLENGVTLQNKIAAAVNSGIGYLPSDRRADGIMAGLSVITNTTIANLESYVKAGLYLNKYSEQHTMDEFIKKLRIKTPSGKTKIMNLSGGNQQKVILARWLCRKPSILLMEQPTRGIDVGAKQEIYRLMRELVNQGISILVMSDEMPELIGLCNRILTMKQGRITSEIDCQKEEKPNEQQIIQHIT
jgi:ribose transport system ATP-binding protein